MVEGLPKLILIVEDDAPLREIYARQFSLAGAEVDIAEGGMKGLEMVKAKDYDLILLDIMMPDIIGTDVMETIRSDPATQNTAVIFITNLGQESVIKKCMELGALGYLIKSSFTPDQLIQEVARLVSQQKPPQSAPPTPQSSPV